jgi:hypothetical protein
VLVLGLSFKADVPDLRNSVVDVIRRADLARPLATVHDPFADPAAARREYDLALTAMRWNAATTWSSPLFPRLSRAGGRRHRQAAADGALAADLHGIWRDRSCPGVSRWVP